MGKKINGRGRVGTGYQAGSGQAAGLGLVWAGPGQASLGQGLHRVLAGKLGRIGTGF